MAAPATKKPSTKTTTPTKKNQKISGSGPGTGPGGHRPGAGRPKGVPNKRTQMLQDMVAASGETPLEYMLKLMRGETKLPADASPQEKAALIGLRFEAAKACAPYIHARLSSVEMTKPPSTGGGAESIPDNPIDAAKAYKDLIG